MRVSRHDYRPANVTSERRRHAPCIEIAVRTRHHRAKWDSAIRRHGAAGSAAAVVLVLAACGDRLPDSRASAPSAVSIAPALPATPKPRPVRHADFGRERPSDDARHIADWVVDSRDNRDAPFVIVDKVGAEAYAFDRNGKLLGAAPVLLGLAKGDDNPPGVGDRPLSAIRAAERITAAGRYVGELGYNLRGEDVLWVDYDAGLSLHRVLTTHPKEHRVRRLATPTTQDNRVSYGCINVPVLFFERVIKPAYRDTKGMVYVLPETRPAHVVFGSYDVDARARSTAQSPDTTLHAAAVPHAR